MKKQMMISMAALAAVLALVVVRITVGYDIEWKGTLEDEYYNQRERAEWNIQEKAEEDALKTFRQLEENPEDQTQCTEEVTACLRYALDHFEEFEKGGEADIQVTAKIAYAHSYITTLYMNSDYDQRVHTATEKRFWRCLVNRYTHVLRSYAIDAVANFQEKAELLEINGLARQLEGKVDEEAAIFVERLADVMKESSK